MIYGLFADKSRPDITMSTVQAALSLRGNRSTGQNVR